MKTIERFFAAVDHVGDWSFSGGEPILHENLADFLRAASRYHEKYDRLLVLTNGTLLPNEELLKVMQECGPKFQVNISNYGADKSKRASELKDCLESRGIKYREIMYHGDDLFCDGWIDLRDHSRKFFTEEELLEHSKECIKHSGGQCLIINGGEMHNCARSIRCMQLGITPRNPDEFVDFWNDEQSNDERRATIQKMLEKPYMSSCAYCAGFRPEAPRFPPAEQLPVGYQGREDEI